MARISGVTLSWGPRGSWREISRCQPPASYRSSRWSQVVSGSVGATARSAARLGLPDAMRASARSSTAACLSASATLASHSSAVSAPFSERPLHPDEGLSVVVGQLGRAVESLRGERLDAGSVVTRHESRSPAGGVPSSEFSDQSGQRFTGLGEEDPATCNLAGSASRTGCTGPDPLTEAQAHAHRVPLQLVSALGSRPIEPQDPEADRRAGRRPRVHRRGAEATWLGRGLRRLGPPPPDGNRVAWGPDPEWSETPAQGGRTNCRQRPAP